MPITDNEKRRAADAERKRRAREAAKASSTPVHRIDEAVTRTAELDEVTALRVALAREQALVAELVAMVRMLVEAQANAWQSDNAGQDIGRTRGRTSGRTKTCPPCVRPRPPPRGRSRRRRRRW